MDFEYFNEFFVLAKERNFSKAADLLFISQSSLTKHIQKMETDMDVTLFKRSSPLALTPAGNYLYEQLEPLYDQVMEAIAQGQKINKGMAGNLSIGFGNYSKNIYAPDVKLFQKQFPEINIQMMIKDQNDLMSALTNDQIDIATLYSINNADYRLLDPFVKLPIVKGQMSFLVHKEDPKYKNKDNIYFSDLNRIQYTLVDNQYYREIHNAMEKLAARHNVKFKSSIVVPSLEDALLHVIMYGGGIFVPGDPNVSYGPEFKKLTIMDRSATYTRYYVWKMSNTNTSILKFANIARDRRAADISKKVIENLK